nr:alginate lyase family protein [Methylorubrum populi]
MAVPPAVVEIKGIDFYTDSKGSVADPAAVAEFAKYKAPLEYFALQLGAISDGEVDSKQTGGESCATQWLTKWAQDGALTKPLKGGYALWLLSIVSAATSFAKVQSTNHSCDGNHVLITDWLHGLMNQVVSNENQGRPPGKENNLTHWAAYGAYVVGMLAGDKSLTDWAIGVYSRALQNVTDDGFLPSELARGQMALHYNLFSATPLMLVRLMAENNGHREVAASDERLKLFIRSSFAAMSDPSRLERAVGTPIKSDNYAALNTVRLTLALYECRFGRLSVAPKMEAPKADWRLGTVFSFKSCPSGKLFPESIKSCRVSRH